MKLKGIEYARKSPLKIPVKSINVKSKVMSDSKEFVQISLLEAVQQWEKEYFIAKGSQGQLRITTLEASIRKGSDRQNVCFGLWKSEKDVTYQGRVSVLFEWVPDPKAQPVRSIVITVQKEQMVISDTTFSRQSTIALAKRAALMLLYEEVLNCLTQEADKLVMPMFSHNSGEGQ
jgi:hypothetical protein